MKKLPYLLALIFVFSSVAFAEESKAPQDQAGKAAASAADNVGKGANQLGSDVSKGTGTILDGVGKFLQEIGHNLSGNPAPASSPAPQTTVQSAPTSQSPAQQVETQKPITK